MKNKLLFIILFVGVWNTPASYAQNTFAPVGAEWWYGGSCYNYDNWCEQGINWRKWADNMQAVKDTVVAGEPSRMLVATRYYNN